MIPPNKAVPPGGETEAERGDPADPPMTNRQADDLRALCEKAGEPFDPSLNETQAAHRIGELRESVGDVRRE